MKNLVLIKARLEAKSHHSFICLFTYGRSVFILANIGPSVFAVFLFQLTHADFLLVSFLTSSIHFFGLPNFCDMIYNFMTMARGFIFTHFFCIPVPTQSLASHNFRNTSNFSFISSIPVSYFFLHNFSIDHSKHFISIFFHLCISLTFIVQLSA